jgi:hypothetical protein
MSLSAAALLALALRVHAPDPYVLTAIAIHESAGEALACRDEANGTSSWGLGQINVRGPTCATPNGYARLLLDPEFNLREAARLLREQRRYHLAHCRHPHDVLEHYAGSGKDARRFAREIRRAARRLKESLRTKGKKR